MILITTTKFQPDEAIYFLFYSCSRPMGIAGQAMELTTLHPPALRADF